MAGTIPVALSQQVDSNGTPLAGALLYLYVVGTVAQPQSAYQDTALSLPLPWPVKADQNGRLPMFYLADGAVHPRLTDANGSVQFDYPNMLVIGPSGGSSPGPGVDPTTIFSSGDIKFRPSAETLSGWVKINGQTIGSATSGASQRANADTQSLFLYLWNTFPDAKCPVVGGRGANALGDFNANKQITLLDWRGRIPVGLDDMGSSAAGNFAGVPFAGGDTAITPAGNVGENTHALLTAELAAHNHGVTDPTHAHNLLSNGNGVTLLETSAGGAQAFTGGGQATFAGVSATQNAATNITINNAGGGGAHNTVQLGILGTWYQRL